MMARGGEAGGDTPSGGTAGAWTTRGRTIGGGGGRRRTRCGVGAGKLTLGGEAGLEPGPYTFVGCGSFVDERKGGGSVAIGLQLGGTDVTGAQVIIEHDRLAGSELVERGERQQVLYFFVVHR